MAHTTASTGTASTLTLADIQRAVDLIGPEPIGEWMRSQGCPPDEWTVVFPERYRTKGPPLWPSYVLFSGVAQCPMFIRRGAVLL